MVKVYSPIGVGLTDTPTTIEHTLGDKAVAEDGQEYVYVQAAEAISQYDFVGIDEDFAASQLTSTEAGDGWMIGVAQSALSADDYGWVCVKGANLTGNVLGSCNADVALYTSGTAGYLDDATTGTKIDGVVAVAANGVTDAASVEVLLTYPRCATF